MKTIEERVEALEKRIPILEEKIRALHQRSIADLTTNRGAKPENLYKPENEKAYKTAPRKGNE
jgi:hypothetical protein